MEVLTRRRLAKGNASMADLMRSRDTSPRPRPDFDSKAPHPEDFAAWCLHPVTRFVAAGFIRAAEMQRDDWTGRTWGRRLDDPAAFMRLQSELARNQAAADAYMAFLETGLERYIELTQKA